MLKLTGISRTIVSTFLVCGVTLAWAPAARPQTAEITAVGVGAILANDVAAARDKAIDDAMRKAVQQALGTHIKSETLVKNFQLVEDRILSWSSGYVSNYDIVREGRGQFDTYEVEMRARVNLADLQNDDNALAELLRKENPRVMVMIAEQNVGERNYRHYFEVDMTAAENAIIEVFRSKGFEVVDPGQVKANQDRDAMLSAIDGNAKQAAAIAAAQQAELIITGKAVAKVATGINLGGMKSCQANISGRIVRASDARILATMSEHAAFPHIDEISGGMKAIEKAAKKGANALVAKVIEEAHKSFYNENSINVRVQGLDTYNDLQKFVNTLKYYIRGVKNVYQRSSAGGYGILDVKILGSASQLARELENKKLDPFAVEVTGVVGNRIDLRVSTAKDQSGESGPDDPGTPKN